MWTISEADVTVGFAVDAKCKGILEHLLVTVARREAKDNPVTLGHALSPQHTCLSCDPNELMDWRRPADRFLHKRGNYP
jgi:hypothetical protein